MFERAGPEASRKWTLPKKYEMLTNRNTRDRKWFDFVICYVGFFCFWVIWRLCLVENSYWARKNACIYFYFCHICSSWDTFMLMLIMALHSCSLLSFNLNLSRFVIYNIYSIAHDSWGTFILMLIMELHYLFTIEFQTKLEQIFNLFIT